MVPGPELLGGAASGAGQSGQGKCPPASQLPEFISAPLWLLPQLPASGWSGPCPSPCPSLSLGSFCVIYFLRRVCIIFSYGCSSCCRGLEVLFFWRVGVGVPFCHCLS